MAPLELAADADGWHAFSGHITLLPGPHSLNKRKEMESCQNALHSDKYFIITTLQDALTVLKESYVRLRSEGAENVRGAYVA